MMFTNGFSGLLTGIYWLIHILHITVHNRYIPAIAAYISP